MSHDASHLAMSPTGTAPTRQSTPPFASGQSGPSATPPTYLTSFIGRERERAAIEHALAGARLLTLLGPGGCGKSRLAAHVAGQLRASFPDGLWWIELAPLIDPALVPATVATALGVRESPGRPLLTALQSALQSRRALLVVDNCEHLLDACARLAEALLGACPELRLLATSREPLGVAGEVTWPVPALSLPEPGRSYAPTALLASEAVRLFNERASAVLPGFTLTEANLPAVERLCRQLDGMPLAIELAAARIRALTVEEITERLDDSLRLLATSTRTAWPRHRTLRATIDWSYDLLADAERSLFNRLAVFAGGWTLAAVEAITGGRGEGLGGGDSSVITHHPSLSPLPEDVLDLLARLVDKSLVTVQTQGGRTRYRLLETIRQYAGERLAASGDEAAVRQQHAQYFLSLVESLEPALNGAQRSASLAQLDAEHDNLRAALRWAAASGNSVMGLRLAGALWWFWFHRGAWSEGADWLTMMLAAAGDAPAPSRAKAQLGAGMLAFARGDYATARAHLTGSATLCRETGDRAGLAAALTFLVLPMVHQGEAPAARPFGDEALSLARTGSDRWLLAIALTNRGIIAEAEREAGTAMAVFEEAVALMRALNDPWGLSLPLRHLGYVVAAQGDDRRATALIRESLALCRDLGEKWFASMGLEDLAAIAARQGDFDRVPRLLGAAEALRGTLGAALRPLYRATYDQTVAAARAALDEATFAVAWAEGQALTFDQALAFALDETPMPARASAAGPGEPSLTASNPAAIRPRPEVTEPPGLRFLALGPACVERDGQVLAAADWGYTLPRALLFFLLSHPPQTKEQIGLVFWPQASPEQLRRNLGVALYHVRRALGRPEAVLLEHDRYAFNRAIGYWFDVEAFEGALDQSERRRLGPLEGRAEDIRQQLEEAIALYRGDFLEDLESGDWYLPRREQLRDRFLEALVALGALDADASQYERAISTYRRALAHEPYLEAAHRGVMRCYARLGEPGLALRHYAALRERLRHELTTTPAAETTALADRLRSGEPV